MTSFSTEIANDLEDVVMIAGDDKTFTYSVYDTQTLIPISLTGATFGVSIFRYGDPTGLILYLPGEISSGSSASEFVVRFPSGSSIHLSGVYQQQVKIVDWLGEIHTPSQGKITIFPSPFI